MLKTDPASLMKRAGFSVLYKRCNLDTNSSTAAAGPVDMTFETLRPGQAKPRLSVRKTGGEDLARNAAGRDQVKKPNFFMR
jgi:hypothetical protein